MGLAGKSVRMMYDNGWQMVARYGDAGVEWEATAGPNAGARGTESATIAAISDDVYFVSWVEDSGTTVSQVLDLRASTIAAFVTFPMGGHRGSQLMRGRIELS